MKESLERYLSDKKIYQFKGKPYYKVKNYKHSYYVDKHVIERLAEGTQEVDLEKNAQYNTHTKGLIKWDPIRKQILLSESKMRVYYEPFELDKA